MRRRRSTLQGTTYVRGGIPRRQARTIFARDRALDEGYFVDANFVADEANDTHKSVSPLYMKSQTQTSMMNFLVEVHFRFGLIPGTLCTVYILDGNFRPRTRKDEVNQPTARRHRRFFDLVPVVDRLRKVKALPMHDMYTRLR